LSGPPAGAPAFPRRREVRFAAKRRPRGLVKADINVTPLVDVVLVLLIIFMVVTPMIARGVDVELPIASHHDRKNDDNRDMIVSINRDGDIYLDADKIPLDRLTTAVEEERRRRAGKGVFLKADHRIDYGKARRAMDAIHAAGVDDVQLGTEEAGK
jgi:biopolymer transport protein TolR